MKNVVAREVAEDQVKAWAEEFGVDIDEDQAKPIVRAVMQGRAEYEEGRDVFHVLLISPLELQNGESLDSVTIHEPLAEQVQSAMKKGGEVDTIKILAAMTGQPVGIMSRLGIRDMNTIGAFIGFFG